MALSIGDWITYGLQYLDSCGTRMKMAAEDLDDAGYYLSVVDLNAAGAALVRAATDFKYGANALSEDPSPSATFMYCWEQAMTKINDDWPSNGGVDMASMLTAMLAATPNELKNFIGIVDAYRVALWNAPFNVEYYAALARGFQQWG